MSGYKLTTVKKQQQNPSQCTAPRTGHARYILFNSLYLERGSNSANNNNDINFPKVVFEEQVMPGAVFSIACTWKEAEAIFISVIFSSRLRFALTLCAMDRSGQCCLSL